MDEPEPEVEDKSHTALHDPRNVDLRLVEGKKYGYTREDAYRVLAGLPPLGTVNVPPIARDTHDTRTPEEVVPESHDTRTPEEAVPETHDTRTPEEAVPETHDTRTPEEVDRDFAGLYGPRVRPEPDPTDQDDEA